VPESPDRPIGLWYFDFAAPDASFGGYVRLVRAGGGATYWAALVGNGRPYVLVRDEGAPWPARGFEIRTHGLWADMHCETPYVHWSVGLEAFAVALDDPMEAWHGERGERVPLGFDLEWDATGEAVPMAGGYRQPAAVTGEVLLGQEKLDVTTVGWRIQAGSAGDLPDAWFAGHSADGRPVWQEGTDTRPLVPLHPAPVLDAERRVWRALCSDGPGATGWMQELRDQA
jgi:hypothetical protein